MDIEKILDAKLQGFKDEILSTVKEFNKEQDSKLENRYMDVSDVSQLMNISKKTVRKYYSEKKLVGEKDFAGRLRFNRTDVEQFIINIKLNKYGI